MRNYMKKKEDSINLRKYHKEDVSKFDLVLSPGISVNAPIAQMFS